MQCAESRWLASSMQEAMAKVTLTGVDASEPPEDMHAVMENAELKGSILQHQVTALQHLQHTQSSWLCCIKGFAATPGFLI